MPPFHLERETDNGWSNYESLEINGQLRAFVRFDTVEEAVEFGERARGQHPRLNLRVVDDETGEIVRNFS